MLAAGKSQAECASELGVSIRTIGRAVARMRAGLWRDPRAHSAWSTMALWDVYLDAVAATYSMGRLRNDS